HACRELLDNYGGHFYAAGITLPEEKLDEFIAMFERVVSSTITDEQLVPEIEIDAEIALSNVRPAFHDLIKQFEPFGPTNMKPVFLSRNVYDHQHSSSIVKE